ncbi:MAG: hypothetical protein FJ254_09685 [Phycisphaerae bacterium]|nr:hypothetical protein [Phycisphaerae bacterium]
MFIEALLLSSSMLVPSIAVVQDQTQSSSQSQASEWPQSNTVGDRTFTVYQPQFDGYDGRIATLSAAITVKQGDALKRGIMWLRAETAPADIAGEVELHDLHITRLSIDNKDDWAARSALQGSLSGVGFTIDRDTMVQDLKLDNARSSGTPGLSFEVPDVRFTEVPTVLVPVDGSPVLAACGSWQKVVNTPFVLLQSPNGRWFVRVGATQWMSAPTMTGTYAASDAPPADVVAALGTPKPLTEGNPVQEPESASGMKPVLPSTVLVTTKPSALVSTMGKPALKQVAAGVSEVTNANVVVLKTASPAAWWTLISGRWFSASDLKGPWAYVPPTQLPSSFRSLPKTGRLAAARASVPGTVEAYESIVAAREIQTVTVKADTPCQMSWRGEPAWSGVDGIDGLSYGTNASQPTFKFEDAFWCCADGMWFKGSSATGPWAITDSVPMQIYRVPPTNPDYAATYVEIFGSTHGDDGSLASVTFGFTAGYLGTYLHDGTTVFGTGYSYSAASDGDTTYDPAPQTYGTANQYDPQSGSYAPMVQDPGYVVYPPDVYPDYLDDGWYGWGWCPGWCCGWGWGWGNSWWGWNHWNNWWNHWHPYWNNNHWNNWQNDHRLYQNERARSGDDAWRGANGWQRAGDAARREDPSGWHRAAAATAAARDGLGAEDRNTNFSRGNPYSWGGSGWESRSTQRVSAANDAATARMNDYAAGMPRGYASGFHPSYQQNRGESYNRSSGGYHGSGGFHGGGGRR